MQVSPRPGWPSNVQGSPQLWQCRGISIFDLRFTIYDFNIISIAGCRLKVASWTHNIHGRNL
jgi:hypothetical protein